MSQTATARRAGEDAFGGVRELIRTALVEQALPSLAVAVAREGEILWEEGFGWADREQRKAGRCMSGSARRCGRC